MKKNTYLPIKLMEKITAKYPDIWKEVEEIQGLNRNGDEWDQRCILPNNLAIEMIVRKTGLKPGRNISASLMSEVAEDAGIIAALTAFKETKQSYKIDPDIEKMLYEQEKDINIPSEIFNNLPFNSFYVSTSHLSVGDCKADGFFVYYDSDLETGKITLRILILSEDMTTLPVIVYINQNTLSENMSYVYDVIEETLPQKVPYTKDEFMTDQIMGYHAKPLQLILYILAKNSDKEYTPSPRKSGPRKVNKLNYREINVWSVGIRTGSALRHRIALNDLMEGEKKTARFGSTHSSPRPHLRRGHWHYYWTGKMDSEDRKLVLKWIAPTFVNAADKETVPVVIHNVGEQ